MIWLSHPTHTAQGGRHMVPSHPDQMKLQAGYRAAGFVQDGMVIGIGTGSTTAYALTRVAEMVRDGCMILGVPTSFQAALRARDLGIPLTTLLEHPQIDLAIDGADQVDPDRRLIKGRGAAQVRERIVADAARRLVIAVDTTKMTPALSGDVPVELVPFSLPVVTRHLERMGGIPKLREGVKKDGPVVSDNGNFIIDVSFEKIESPGMLEKDLNNIPGVVGCGLFSEFVEKTTVVVGREEGVLILSRDHV